MNRGQQPVPPSDEELESFKDGITRRAFLKGAAMASAAGAIGYWTSNPLTTLAEGFVGQEPVEPVAEPISEEALAAAVNIYVGDNIQSFVTAATVGTTFVLKCTDRAGNRGVHRLQQVIPKHDQVFVGERDASGNRLTVMNGATILPASGWVPDGAYYRYDNAPLQPGWRVINGQGYVGPGLPGDKNAPCTRPEDLFITTNGACKFLKRVKSKSGVKAGVSWYFDEAARKIYIAATDNPGLAGRVIELSLMKYAFGYEVLSPGPYLPEWPLNTDPRPESAHPNIYNPSDWYSYKPRHVTIQDVIVEKYANPAQTGAIGYFRPGNDWIIRNNEVRLNHGSGIKFKGRAWIKGNHTHDNGQSGMGAGDGNRLQEHGGGSHGLEEWGFNGGYAGNGAIVEYNVIENNNRLNFNPGWEAGGTKFSQCYNLMVRHNIVRNNKGPGLWTDFSYLGTKYDGNYVRTNNGPGIFHETGFDAAICDNTVIGNATDNSNYGSQIYLSASSNVKVYNNLVMGWKGRHGIMVVQNPARYVEDWPVACYNDEIFNNEIHHAEANTGLNGGVATYGIEEFYKPGNIRFHDNRYHCIDPNGVHWAWRGKWTLVDMQTQGMETGSTLNGDITPHVLAAGPAAKMYRYNGTAFALIQGLGVAVEGGLDFSGFHVSPDGTVWKLTRTAGWVRLPVVKAVDVAANYDGRYACVAGADGYLYHLQSGTFKKLMIPTKRVSIDNNGTVWTVDHNGSIWRYFRLSSGGLDIVGQVMGCIAQDIGCGGGEVYAAGKDGRLYRYNPGLNVFQVIQGLGVRVAVQADGVAWHANSARMVYKLDPTKGWVRVLGCQALDVGA